MKNSKLLFLCLFVFLVSSCGGGNSNVVNRDDTVSLPIAVPPPVNDVIQIKLDFQNDLDGWFAGFSDYPVNTNTDFNLSSGFSQLPEPLLSLSGFSISGTNRSDDLFMFIKKGFSGFSVNSQYKIEFKITFATTAQSNCVGVGGSPGSGVSVKAGASILEPLSILNSNNEFRMNIDKGVQKNSGKDAIVIGDVANSQACDPNNAFYELKTLNNDTLPFTVKTDSTGVLWFTFSTDSGFESTTHLYYINGSIIATKTP